MRRKIFLRRFIVSMALAAVIATVIAAGMQLIKPTIGRTRIRTSRVDLGTIEATITAFGTVVPEFEQVLSSPVNARVLKILKRPGAILKQGDPILQLDLNESVLAIEKLEQQIDLKANQQSKAKLDLAETLSGLKNRWELKNLDYKSSQATTARTRTMFQEGLISQERMSEAILAEEKARLELKQLEDSYRNAQQSTQTLLEGLALEMKTLVREKLEARRQLELATTNSDRKGVLTWVINEEGSTVQKGAVLARLADLGSFRVEATVSDVHANRLSSGLPVKVKLNDDTSINGAISRINPTVTNGVITIVVSLDDKSNEMLRSNLRVDVLIATERKNNVMRVKKGPFANGTGLRDVFVIRGDMAVRTQARLGIAGADHFEVIDGLLEGDEVIISDMSDFIHVKEIKVR
ncbi:MAG: efflux RND transporter periplasmic adaptor subunit [Acidobacteria bacterium]|nr:efflux RND transporter periplasmic adaptor subunit [Acidobacteriota bacterium]